MRIQICITKTGKVLATAQNFFTCVRIQDCTRIGFNLIRIITETSST